LQDFESLQNSPTLRGGEALTTQDLNTDGILVMALKELFSRVKDPDSEKQRVFIIRCSYFEIYNDAVYDLLNVQKELAFAEPLQLNEDIKVRHLKYSNPILIEKGIRCQRSQGVRC
jgi:Kinesin motor domain